MVFAAEIKFRPPPHPPGSERAQCKPTAAESIDNHSSILICPPDILFAESGPRRGLGPTRARTIIEPAKDHIQGLILMPA